MAWYHRLLNLTRGNALSHDLDREIQFHIVERADELMAQGMSKDDALREARRRFGHVQQQKERTRDADSVVWLESLVADVRYALRALRLSPGFTLVAVLSIGLGVGANTAIFSLINAVMLKSLPVPHAEELVRVERVAVESRGERSLGSEFTNPLWEEIRDHQDAVDAFAYGTTSFNLATGGEARRIDGSWVSGSYFPVLGARPLAGRLLARSDDNRGCPGVAVVSPGFAAREYGAPESALGRTVSLDGHPFAIVGVSEPSFFGVDVGSRIQVYAPICAEAILRGSASGLDEHSKWWLQLMGRPRNHYTAEQVNARLAGVSPAIHAASLPADWPANFQAEYLKSTLRAEPAATGYSVVRARSSEALFALMVVVGVVLLIACANVAHLLLARAATRQREMALRLALGAGRARLIRQLLTESVLLALLGSALGAVFARWASGFMVGLLANRNNQVWLDLGLDLRVLGFTIGVATLTGILFGLAPAWRATRIAPRSALQAQGRGAASGPGRFAITKGLVVGQVALSLVLLVAAGLLLRSFQKLVTLDPGFQREGVLLVGMDVENAGYPEAQRVTVYRDVLERLRAIPGVRSASASLITPISGRGWNGDIEADGFVPQGERGGIVWFNGVSDGFFATMSTRRVAGRDFGPQDVTGGAPVAIINESMAHRVFGNANPIGKIFRTRNGRGTSPPTEVIGVVQDAKYRSLKDANTATAYLPMTQAELWGSSMNFELRADGDPAALMPAVRSLAGDVNHAISLDFVTLSEQVAASLAGPRLLATLSAFFGALALLLATVGLYGTVAYSVARRRSEIGIRIALGAERSRVVRMILGEVGRLMAAGAVLGVLIALAATRLLKSFLYGLTATDPATLAFSVAALAAVALAAGALPAWRAARLDPMDALREE
jgi:putative ABC transport system permease protein